ncbi:hypothetical protein ACN4EG_20720 [Alkalinema pantanalense CENA528]
MDQDSLAFLIGVLMLFLYLIFSAMTEMGTKWPGRRNDDEEG